MAKLSKEKAKQAEALKDEVPSFGVAPPGVYLCRLRSVDTSKTGPAGPYWVWEFETVGVKDEPANKRFWENTSLSEKAIGRIGKQFENFGMPADSDTEDAIGKLIAVEVKIGTVKGGDNDGAPRNEVVATHPAEVHAWYEEYVASQPSQSTSSAGDFD